MFTGFPQVASPQSVELQTVQQQMIPPRQATFLDRCMGPLQLSQAEVLSCVGFPPTDLSLASAPCEMTELRADSDEYLMVEEKCRAAINGARILRLSAWV